MQTGPGYGPIQYITDVPENISRTEVVAAWLRNGAHVEEASDALEFENHWPIDVKQAFDSGHGETRTWARLLA